MKNNIVLIGMPGAGKRAGGEVPALLLVAGGFHAAVAVDVYIHIAAALQQGNQILPGMGALLLLLVNAAVTAVFFPQEEAQRHLANAGLFVEAVLPDVGHILPILADELVTQHIFQLPGRGNVEDQHAAGTHGFPRRVEEGAHILVHQQIIHTIAGRDHRIHLSVQVELAHILLDEGQADALLAGLLRSDPEHLLTQIHAGHLISPAQEGQGQSAGTAGAFAHLAARANAAGLQQAGVEIRPILVVHIVHELIIDFRKACIQSDYSRIFVRSIAPIRPVSLAVSPGHPHASSRCVRPSCRAAWYFRFCLSLSRQSIAHLRFSRRMHHARLTYPG